MFLWLPPGIGDASSAIVVPGAAFFCHLGHPKECFLRKKVVGGKVYDCSRTHNGDLSLSFVCVFSERGWSLVGISPFLSAVKTPRWPSTLSHTHID